MTRTKIRFEETCRAPREVVYDLLADLPGHLEWAGERQSEGFRLLTMDAPPGPAEVGTEFRSTGSDGKKRVNVDRSVVTEATRPSTFEFVTEGRCVTKSAGDPVCEGTYIHRYEITPTSEGSRVAYSVEVTRLHGGPANMLRTPLIGRLLWRMVGSWMRKGLGNLLILAESRVTKPTLS